MPDDRFSFGKNWLSFLARLDVDRVSEAERSLRGLLQQESLEGLSFLDIGSGSGLFSLAAHRLGARRVHSFDYDPHSVAATDSLRHSYAASNRRWVVERGDVLDSEYVAGLGKFDIVYSWGVLHHTGEMWHAIEHAADCVADNGQLSLALYNDEGARSRFWRRVKRTYCSGALGRAAVCSVFVPYLATRAAATSIRTGINQFREYRRSRGMSITHDWIDWLGGYPFEVASADAVVGFLRERGFKLLVLRRCEGHGNNEFAFTRDHGAVRAG